MRHFLLWAVLSASSTAQIFSFTPQDQTASQSAFLKTGATVWQVSVCRAQTSTFSGSQILQIFDSHGYSAIDRTLALRLVEKAQGSNWAVVLTKILGASGILTASAAVIQSKANLAASPGATKAIAIGGVVAGMAVIIEPYVAKEQPVAVLADFEALVLKPLLPIGPDGCGAALFFAKQTSEDKAFTVTQ